VAHPAITADLGQTLDVHSNSAAKVTFDHIFFINTFAEQRFLGLCKVLDSCVWMMPVSCRIFIALALPMP
jgi:hypothetical protein